MPGFDEHLAREFVQGLVRSAIDRGLDPAARLRQFRTLQEVIGAKTRVPDVARGAEQLFHAINLKLVELAAVKS
jgi:hypothetical protein